METHKEYHAYERLGGPEQWKFKLDAIFAFNVSNIYSCPSQNEVLAMLNRNEMSNNEENEVDREPPT